MTEIFTASAQYNDWKGTAAADNSFDKSINDILSDRKLKTGDEILVGVSLYTGENGFVSISAYLIDIGGYENAKVYLEENPIPAIKKVYVENLTAEEFLSLFKRFNVAMSLKGLNLTGREIETNE